VAAPFNPPVKNEDFILYAALGSTSDGASFKSNPTIASGDWKVSKDGGALTDLTTLPVVTPAASVMVKITLSATEMNADVVTIVGIDQTTPKEWTDFVLSIPTTAP